MATIPAFWYLTERCSMSEVAKRILVLLERMKPAQTYSIQATLE